jgi:carbonic anhydrase
MQFQRPLVAAAVALFLVPPLHARQADTPEQLWQQLTAGNHSFVDGTLTYRNLAKKRAESADHQSPPVSILSCADSRVPPELVFDRSINDLFVVRVAGTVADPFDIASLEYAVAHGWTKLIVVMGHSQCGAVNAALKTSDPSTPSLLALVQRIRESFDGIPRTDSPSAAEMRRAIEANTRFTAKYLVDHSSVLRDAVAKNQIEIVPAYYDLATGKVERLK